MKKFLLLLHEDIEAMQALSPKEMNQLLEAHMAWTNQLVEKGHLLAGDGLEESVIKDGPYIESKEMIGGYYLLQAESMDALLDVVKSCPCHLWGGTTEIRPIMDYEAH